MPQRFAVLSSCHCQEEYEHSKMQHKFAAHALFCVYFDRKMDIQPIAVDGRSRMSMQFLQTLFTTPSPAGGLLRRSGRIHLLTILRASGRRPPHQTACVHVCSYSDFQQYPLPVTIAAPPSPHDLWLG